MSKRLSKEEVAAGGLNTDIVLRPTDPSEPLPEASIQATSKVVHAYVAPPVVNLQDQVGLRGRKPLPSETETYRYNEAESRAATVENLKSEIKRETHIGYSDHITTMEDDQRAHAASLAKIREDMRRAKQFEPREVVIARESKAHQENLDLILSEMNGTIHTEDYSGGYGGD